MRIVSLFRAMTRLERRILAVLSSAFLLALTVLLVKFYYAETVLVPTTGGTYIEGSVGELQGLNPWFIVQNDVNRDIVSLVFAGLQKFNPQTKKIEDDLAVLSHSSDSRIYTLRIKDHVFFHDSTREDPHPVTADDVLFTFKTVQDPDFPNTLLRQNFRGVKLEKIDDRTVRFTLDEPYSFFASNLTLGLLPKRSFEGVPVRLLDQELDFGFHPVGAGPYRVRSIVPTELSTEVTLERFTRELEPGFRLDRVVFRIFSDYPTLLSDLRNLDGIRLVPRSALGEPLVPRHFRARRYTLPQYVALFMNLDRKALHDEKLRLGLQLGTQKQEIVDALKNGLIVDTPLLEINMADWHYRYDSDAAQGALFASHWNMPEKIRLQRLLEQREANAVGKLRVPAVALLDTGSVLTLTGAQKDVSRGARLNGIFLHVLSTASGAWTVSLPTAGGTGALTIGENLLKLTNAKGEAVDSAFLTRTTDPVLFGRAQEEQRLVDLFIVSREGKVPPSQHITIANLALERGMLRRRVPADPVSIRRSDTGQPLSLLLLTSPSPPEYARAAAIIAKQWATLGVEVRVEVPRDRDAFQKRLVSRDYDLLLFGQSLLDIPSDNLGE